MRDASWRAYEFANLIYSRPSYLLTSGIVGYFTWTRLEGKSHKKKIRNFISSFLRRCSLLTYCLVELYIYIGISFLEVDKRLNCISFRKIYVTSGFIFAVEFLFIKNEDFYDLISNVQ